MVEIGDIEIGEVENVKKERVFVSYFDDILGDILEEKKYKIREYLYTAIKFNDIKTLNILSYMVDNNIRIRIFNCIARYGNIDTFLFFSKIYNSDKNKRLSLFSNCVRYGNLELSKYFIDIGYMVRFSNFLSLSRCKKIECFKYCIWFYEGDISIILRRTRNIEIANYLIDNFKDKIGRIDYSRGELENIKVMYPLLYRLLITEMIVEILYL